MLKKKKEYFKFKSIIFTVQRRHLLKLLLNYDKSHIFHNNKSGVLVYLSSTTDLKLKFTSSGT
jgi:hypothetical protein